MNTNAVNPNSLRQRVIALEVGQSLFVSIDEHSETVARHYASQIGFRYNRTYSAKRDRERRGYVITREA